MAYNIAPSKQDLLVSGTNIKTINSNSILGSGNLTIAGLPTSTNPTDADKVVAVDSAGTSSWQYAGLGAGSLGTNNVILGRSKPGAITTASNLVVIGVGAGNSFTTASKTIAIGTNAVNSNNGATDVVAIGDSAQCSTNGVSIGSSTNSNQNCVMIGKGVGNSSAAQTVSIGVDSYSGTTGNVVIGFQAGSTSAGDRNVFIGAYNGNNSTNSGTDNTAVGYGCGYFLSGGSSNVFLGKNAGLRSTTQSNELFIDNQDRTTYANQQTNSLIYGVFNATPASQTLKFNAATTSTYGLIANEIGGDYDSRIEGDTDQNLVFVDASTDKVGIGTATPAEKLDVGTGNARVSNGDLILNTAGNGLKIKTGADATAGLATISNGNSSVTVNTNKCSATSIILVTNQTSTAYVAVTTKTSGSFKIEHANAVGADQECAWFIINPA